MIDLTPVHMTPVHTMHAHLLALVLPIISLSQTGLYASSYIARAPAAVTQRFDDGSEVTLVCPLGTRSPLQEPCAFEMRQGNRRSRFQFDPLNYGYPIVFQEFWVFGNINDGNLQFSLSVQCMDEDLALIGNENEGGDVSCKLMFNVVDGKLLLEYVEVTAEANENFIIRHRETAAGRSGPDT